MGVPLPQIRSAVLSFTAVEHRIEFVEEKNGVAYYNDSKGTKKPCRFAVSAICRAVAPRSTRSFTLPGNVSTLKKQFFATSLGLAAMYGVSKIDYHKWERLAWLVRISFSAPGG